MKPWHSSRSRVGQLALCLASMALLSLAPAPTATAINCTSPADCLSRMTLDENGMETGIAMHVAVALSYLAQRASGEIPARVS